MQVYPPGPTASQLGEPHPHSLLPLIPCPLSSWARLEADLSLLCATFHGKALGHMVGRPEREAGYEYLLGPISRAVRDGAGRRGGEKDHSGERGAGNVWELTI